MQAWERCKSSPTQSGVSEECRLGWGALGKPGNPFPPSACFSHTLTSLGPAVLTFHLLPLTVPGVPWKPPSCVAWELGWGVSPESTSAPTHFSCGSRRPPGTSTEWKFYGRARRSILVKIPSQSFQWENLQASSFSCY